MSALPAMATRPGAAELARRAMRLMAVRRLPPTPTNYRLAWEEVGGAGDAAEPARADAGSGAPSRRSGQGDAGWSARIGRLVLALDATLGDELATLAIQISESLAGIARAQQWSQTLVDTVRSALTRPLRAEAVSAATRMLRHVYAEQSDLADSRQASADAPNKALSQWQGWIADLDRTAERFATNLDGHARRVGECTGIEDARRIVESVVAEAGSMRSEITISRERFQRARSRVDALRERPLALAMIDIDDFKCLNDELGHQAGDRALRHLCVELREGFGADGLVARYGGEEFVLLTTGASIDVAASRVAQLQARLAIAPLVVDRDSRVLRYSAGVTVRAETDPLESMLERIDEALYRAKRAGKNCIRRA